MVEIAIVILLLLVLFLFLLLIFRPIRIIRDYERLVLFRLGRFVGERGPGLVWLWPIIDQTQKVSLREDFLEIPSQTCITQDNAPIDIDFLIYWKVVDPGLSVIKVRDFAGASQGIATTTLRAVIGDIPLDDVLAKREQINEVLRTKLDEVTERWGVKVTGVEIREIVPPREIQTAMNRQMAAERERRAVVTESDGKREASIKVAEGAKQAAILTAEGAKQAAILTAEGQREAAILNAEGFGVALTRIYESAQAVDVKTMQLQYLDALKALGAGPATKFIVPLEFTNLVAGFAEQKLGGAPK
ncbi:MAG: Modulator of FtsH protease HflK [Chloroflexi bacterium ADurb.Bin325]|nr:MAG: Modulator of FtsH protease HflK [Chloroflexi bacterium ADurb.Bin325]